MSVLIGILSAIVGYLLFNLQREKKKNLDLRITQGQEIAKKELEDRQTQAAQAAANTKKEVIKYEDARSKFNARAKSHLNKKPGDGK